MFPQPWSRGRGSEHLSRHSSATMRPLHMHHVPAPPIMRGAHPRKDAEAIPSPFVRAMKIDVYPGGRGTVVPLFRGYFRAGSQKGRQTDCGPGCWGYFRAGLWKQRRIDLYLDFWGNSGPGRTPYLVNPPDPPEVPYFWGEHRRPTDFPLGKPEGGGRWAKKLGSAQFLSLTGRTRPTRAERRAPRTPSPSAGCGGPTPPCGASPPPGGAPPG